MAFPTLSALAEGYKVYTVVDASGNWSKMATDITLARVIQAGAIPIDTLAVMSEIQKTWNRPDAAEFADIYAEVMPNYGLLIESYQRAFNEGQKSEESKKVTCKENKPQKNQSVNDWFFLRLQVVNPAQKKHLDCYQGVISSKLSESASRIKGLISPTL